MDIALAVGGSFLSAFLQVLFDRMATPEFLNLFRQHKDYDLILENLNWKLLILQAVLEDAENKQTKIGAVKKWLDKLQEVVYQAEDLLDLINTEALRVSASPDLSTHVTTVEFLNGIMPQLEDVVRKLDGFEQKIGILGLVKEVHEPKKQAFRPPSTSLVDEKDVYGRDADRDNIIEALLSDSIGDQVSVISIVGIGGLGKTTLAQLVYNDERVKNEFDVKVWVCISEEYDALRITKSLLHELNISISDSNESFNSLQVKLKEGLSRKKFLIVLDDVWNRDYGDWLDLSSPFSGGKEGSKIIVTTRDEKVASMMGNQYTYPLHLMSYEYCCSLFEKHALNYRDAAKISELEPIGKEIVKKCRGLPLAVKVVAGFLRLKDTIEEWNKVLRSDEWDQANNQGILPSLRLSYNHLSSQLKRCFAYCAVFPKDYLFRKDEVILLWMANDLLEGSGSDNTLEVIGDTYFSELTFRSLFQKSGNDKFSMHDLVNDLAKFVTGKDFLRLECNQQHKGSSSIVRHFSYIGGNSDVFVKFKPLYESKVLRTFLPLCLDEDHEWCKFRLSPKLLVDILPALKSLRVLSLCYYSIDELPDAFSNLSQLRLLNLSYTHIERLPSWICGFYNLQTLLLVGCLRLTDFPEGMEKLINLRHLDISGVPLIKMPIDIGKLENLQFLSTFVVSKWSGSGIEELGKLSNLHGEFTLFGLENVGNARNASMAKMKDKIFIEKLTLNWNGDVDDSLVALKIFENLEPHSNIKHLEIHGYCGTRFPNWLENPSFDHITYLRISNCEYCFSLPAIWRLPCLIHLFISGLNNVREMGEEINENTFVKQFPCLKELRISNMREWKQWHIPKKGGFSCLEELYIFDCPKLIGEIPKQLPSLRKLTISNCPGLVNANRGLTIFEPKADLLPQFHSLRGLNILQMPTLKDTFVSVDLNLLLPSLDTLVINKCEELVSFPINRMPAALKRLEAIDCRNWELGTNEMTCVSIEWLYLNYCSGCIKNNLSLGSFPNLCHVTIRGERLLEEVSNPHGNQTLTSLQSLELLDCDNFMSFPVGGLPAPNLSSIFLCNCPKLKSLPERMNALLPSLRKLQIWYCPEIECFPEGGFPSSLEELHIISCKRLWGSHREWGLHRLPSLRKFHLACINEGETFPLEDLLLPSTLTSLILRNHRDLKTINSETPKHITCLESLSIQDCGKLQSLPEEGLPASLSKLTILDCPKLQSLPEEGLPASLSELTIQNCPNLHSLPEEGLPASLSELTIQNCPNLHSLPEEGLPASLSKLTINYCSLLKQRLEWEKGEDWPKVSHIPFIEVNYVLVP